MSNPKAEDLDLTKLKSCQHCNGNKHAKIVKRTWPDGQWDWMCHRCGRKIEPGRESRARKKGGNNYVTLTETEQRNQIDRLKPTKEGGIMHIDQFPGRYLKASDLQGHPRKFKIARVEIEYKFDREVWVTYFESERKGWPMSETSLDIIAKIADSPDTDDWTGVEITLYPATFKRRGKMMDVIRVEEPVNGNGSGELEDSNEPPNDEVPPF